MALLRFIITLSVILVVAAAPAEPPVPEAGPTVLKKRLEKSWILDAEVIAAVDFTIYFKGAATGEFVGKPAVWLGKVVGEILVLTKAYACVCEGVMVQPNGKIAYQGNPS